MINTDQSSQFHPSGQEHPSISVRTPIFSYQNSSVQPQISVDLQKIFHKTLIPISSDSPAINHKSSELNDDFGLLVCEIHALFKVIHNQGVAIDPDFQKLDKFGQRLDELNLAVNITDYTKKERKRANEEINHVKEYILEMRQLAKELDIYHPLSLALGESEAKFVDRYNSESPGSALTAAEEFTNMLNNFAILKQNVFDPLREKADDDRVGGLYEAEQEELIDIIEEWSQTVILQTDEEIHELSRCLVDAKDEDIESFQRQAMALDRQLTMLKANLRNTKVPDPTLKSPLHSLILNINRQQRELHKIVDKQKIKELAPLEYGKDEWLKLAEQRPKAPESWLKTAMTQIGNPSEWNTTVKNIAKTFFDGILLLDNAQEMGRKIQSRKSKDAKQADTFKADNFSKSNREIAIRKEKDLSASFDQVESENNSNFITQAPSEIKSVPIESNLIKRREKLQVIEKSLEEIQKRLPHYSFSRRAKELQNIVTRLNNEVYSSTSVAERADWLQAVDDLEHANSVLQNNILNQALNNWDWELFSTHFSQTKMDPNLIETRTINIILHAIRNGKIESVKDFLRTIDVNLANKNGETLLTLASESYANFDLIKILVEIPNIDLNYKDNKNGYTALINACKNNDVKLVNLLVSMPQIDINTQDNNGNTALLFAEMYHHTDIVHMIKSSLKDNISEHLKHFKILSHSWELAGKIQIGNSKLRLEGFQSHLFAEFMIASLNEFKSKYPASIPDKQVQRISKALNGLETFTSKKALSEFNAGEPVLVSTGFRGHAITVLLYDSYLVICNKGAASLRPIEAYKINPNLVTEDTFNLLLYCKDRSFDMGFKGLFRESETEEFDLFFMDEEKKEKPLTFLQKLEAKTDKTSEWLESLQHTTTRQTVGNCSWESPETALYALMALDSFLNVIQDPNNVNLEDEISAQAIYETFSKLEKFTRLQAVIQTLGDIEERILMSSTKKESMVEGINIIKSSYSRDDLKDFWDQRNVIEIKFQNILSMIKGQKKTPNMELNIYKTQKYFDSMIID